MRAEPNHVVGSYPLNHHAVKPGCSGSQRDRRGSLRDSQDARYPLRPLPRKPYRKKRFLTPQTQLHGLRNGPALIDRNRSIAERCQNPLARQPFRVAEGFHQLKHWGAPNRLCPEKHAQIIASAMRPSTGPDELQALHRDGEKDRALKIRDLQKPTHRKSRKKGRFSRFQTTI